MCVLTYAANKPNSDSCYNNNSGLIRKWLLKRLFFFFPLNFKQPTAAKIEELL